MSANSWKFKFRKLKGPPNLRDLQYAITRTFVITNAVTRTVVITYAITKTVSITYVITKTVVIT